MRSTSRFPAVARGPSHVGADEIVADLEIVLAVDASGSVDDDEFQLQLERHRRGFRDPAVLQAIAGVRQGASPPTWCCGPSTTCPSR